MGTLLRRGNAHPAASIRETLAPMVARLQAACPSTLLLLRAAAGFAVPGLSEFCAAHDLGYTIAIPANPVFQRAAASLLQQALAQDQATGEKAKRYGQFTHQAQSWPRPRRGLVKVEAGAEGTNTRFLVTNRSGDPQARFSFYQGRGQTENYSKELKNQFQADRLACSRFTANAFRLVWFALADQLVTLFRRTLADPELRSAQLQTLRVKLFKVGARLHHSTRRFWLHLASGWPYHYLLATALHQVSLVPAPPGGRPRLRSPPAPSGG